MNMSKEELSQYLKQSLDMALQLNGESSYTNAFTVVVVDDGFHFIPRLPCTFVINNRLYQDIYQIASTALFPRFTLLQQNSPHVVALDTEDIHVQRALKFSWMTGITKRLTIPSIKNFVDQVPKNHIPITENITLNLDDVTSILVAGNSGSGKSYLLTYLLHMLHANSTLLVVDPKRDSPSRWCRDNDVPCLAPSTSRNKNDYLSTVSSELNKCLDLILERQTVLFNNPQAKFVSHTIVIDELLALSDGTAKNVKEAFFSQLMQISLLGRATKVHLLLVSQRLDHSALPIACREQANVLIQVG